MLIDTVVKAVVSAMVDMVVCGLVVRFLRCGFSAAPACTRGERDFLRAFVVLPGELCPRTQTVQKYTDRRPDGIEENSRVSRIFQSIVSRSPWTQLAIEREPTGHFSEHKKKARHKE